MITVSFAPEPSNAYMHVVVRTQHIQYNAIQYCKRAIFAQKDISATNGRRVKKRSAPPCFSFRVECLTRRQSLIRSRSCKPVMRACTMPIVVRGLGLGTAKFGQITDPRSPFLESVARARGAARYSTVSKYQDTTLP